MYNPQGQNQQGIWYNCTVFLLPASWYQDVKGIKEVRVCNISRITENIWLQSKSFTQILFQILFVFLKNEEKLGECLINSIHCRFYMMLFITRLIYHKVHYIKNNRYIIRLKHENKSKSIQIHRREKLPKRETKPNKTA